MRICIVGKISPIQGGVSRTTLETAVLLGKQGHQVSVVTNSLEVETPYRQVLLEEDLEILNQLKLQGVKIYQLGLFRRHSHIPASAAFESRLIGRTLEIIEQDRIDLVIGWYFLPYGVAAAVAARHSNKPCYLIHAGSDLGRLSKNEDLKNAFGLCVKMATGILHMPHPEVVSVLDELGATKEQLKQLGGVQLPQSTLPRRKLRYDSSAFIQESTNHFRALGLNRAQMKMLKKMDDDWLENKEELIIGIYGKVGASKGTDILLGAINNLRAKGLKIKLLQILSGSQTEQLAYLNLMIDLEHLNGGVKIIPPIPPWKIESFLEDCHVACFLENNFSIPFHTPRLPLEIMSTGVCLLTTPHCFKNTGMGQIVRPSENIWVTPQLDISSLANTLKTIYQNPEQRADIAHLGKYTCELVKNRIDELKIGNPLLGGILKLINEEQVKYGHL